MKILIALCLCGLSMPLPAQTMLRTFTSQDGTSQFKHSDVLVDCMSAGKTGERRWVVGPRILYESGCDLRWSGKRE